MKTKLTLQRRSQERTIRLYREAPPSNQGFFFRYLVPWVTELHRDLHSLQRARLHKEQFSHSVPHHAKEGTKCAETAYTTDTGGGRGRNHQGTPASSFYRPVPMSPFPLPLTHPCKAQPVSLNPGLPCCTPTAGPQPTPPCPPQNHPASHTTSNF